MGRSTTGWRAIGSGEFADALVHEALAGGNPRSRDDASNFVLRTDRRVRNRRSTTTPADLNPNVIALSPGLCSWADRTKSGPGLDDDEPRHHAADFFMILLSLLMTISRY